MQTFITWKKVKRSVKDSVMTHVGGVYDDGSSDFPRLKAGKEFDERARLLTICDPSMICMAVISKNGNLFGNRDMVICNNRQRSSIMKRLAYLEYS